MSKPSYEELEAQLHAVVAENVALKAANEVALKILNDEDTMVTSLWASSIHKVEVETPATDAAIAALRAEWAANAIPEGYVLMPKQIHLDADAVECICSQGGDGGYNYGDFTDVVLWVGEVENDDGSKTHGLNVYSADYPEEGSINLCEFAAQLRQSVQVKGDK